MRLAATAFAATSLGLLSGCSEAPANKAVDAAPQQQLAEVHRYEVSGNLLVDSDTGKVWKYDGSQLVPVAYKLDTSVASTPVEKWERGKDGKLHRVD